MEKNKRHVEVPNSVVTINSEDMTVRERNKAYTDRGVYLHLRSFMNGKTMTALVSFETLSEQCKMSRGGTINAVNRLIQNGDIEKVKIGKCNGYKFNPHSDKFQMYDYEFIKNPDLDIKQQSVLMSIQPYMFINDNIGKVTLSLTDMSKLSNISIDTLSRRFEELEKQDILIRRITKNLQGNDTTAYEFNIAKIGQLILCKLEEHDEDIKELKRKDMENTAKIKMLENQVYSLKKIIAPNSNNNQEEIML